jgi:type III secretion protein R
MSTKMCVVAGSLGGLCLALPSVAFAQNASTPGLGQSPVSTVLVLAALTLLPFVLVMTTSFVKFSVVFSILRSAIGTPQIPPSIVITSLSVILTAYVMAPTGAAMLDAVNAGPKGKKASELLSERSAVALYDAAGRAKEPLRTFMIKHSRPSDRLMFRDLARRLRGDKHGKISQRDMLVVVPAFVIGQLSAAFKIGFLIFVPFLIIDMVVANVLLALGMHMLSPTTVSLPFKLLLFVLVDGWTLIVQGLVLSYT